MLAVLLSAMLLSGAEAPAKKAVDPNKMVCKSKPILGSRLKKTKTCMTVAEWNSFRVDRDQARRDQVNGFAQSYSQ